MTGKKAAAVEALKAYNADHGQGFHPSVTCDGTQQSPLFGWRYKHKGRNHNLCEAEFNKLPDAEKANYKKMMPPRWWDEEAQKRKAEAEVQKHLARIWQEREKRDIEREPSLVEIPRILFRKKPGGSAQSTQSAQSSQSSLLQELEKHARRRLKTQMSDMVLKHAQLEKLWSLLKRNASQPQNPADERINWDDFSAISETMHTTAGHASELTDAQIECFFGARHFVLFDLDKYGRIPIVHYFQWVMRKNELMRTRSELSTYDSGGNGWLTEADLQGYVKDLRVRLPALTGLLDAFVHFYVVTAVRKFFFFLDPRRRGRIRINDVLLSPILQELLDLRRPDLSAEDLRSNWFSQQSAAQIYDDYLQLDIDQNGMLSAYEIQKWRDEGLSTTFVNRLWQELNLYPKGGSGSRDSLEMDYKIYLDFVLANTYKTTFEALQYHFRVLDFNKTGRLTVFEINYFFRAIVEKMMYLKYRDAYRDDSSRDDSSRRDSDAVPASVLTGYPEREREAAKLLEDVVDEIFDMVKPEDPNFITLKDLVECKVGETVVNILTDVWGFLMYDQREQLMHDKNDD